MLYGRWTISYFDPAKKEAMLSNLTSQADAMVNEVTGAVQARIIQVSDNRLVVHAIYENKAADYVSRGLAKTVLLQQPSTTTKHHQMWHKRMQNLLWQTVLNFSPVT